MLEEATRAPRHRAHVCANERVRQITDHDFNRN